MSYRCISCGANTEELRDASGVIRCVKCDYKIFIKKRQPVARTVPSIQRNNMYTTIIEVEADDADAIVSSLKPDLDDAIRFKADLRSEDGKIVVVNPLKVSPTSICFTPKAGFTGSINLSC